MVRGRPLAATASPPPRCEAGPGAGVHCACGRRTTRVAALLWHPGTLSPRPYTRLRHRRDALPLTTARRSSLALCGRSSGCGQTESYHALDSPGGRVRPSPPMLFPPQPTACGSLRDLTHPPSMYTACGASDAPACEPVEQGRGRARSHSHPATWPRRKWTDGCGPSA